MMNMVYFDNAATTKVDRNVGELLGEIFINDFGNASSTHALGARYKEMFLNARNNIANYLNCPSENILFTSGATESNNTAIANIINKATDKKRRVVVSPIEHPSVLEPIKRYQSTNAIELDYLCVDSSCKIDLDDMIAKMGDDVLAVIVMAVNNETGAIQPISDISNICKKHRAVFHCDFVQALGKIPFLPDSVDFASFSAHKIYGPKGIGLLYVKNPQLFHPYIFGGGQQSNYRSGTEPVELIVALELTFKNLYQCNVANNQHIKSLKACLMDRFKDCPDIRVNSSPDAVPHIISISINGVRSDSMSLIFQQKGVMVSQGSACSSNHDEKILSHVLLAMGLPDDRIRSSFRVSFGKYNTFDEVGYLADVIEEAVGKYKVRW
jgi:cysteine desulfurase